MVLVGMGWRQVVTTVCGVGPMECSNSSDGNKGNLQTHLLVCGRSEIGRRGEYVSSDDDRKTLEDLSL